jgi:hypothetical protein
MTDQAPGREDAPATDETAVRALCRQLWDAWNQRSSDAFAALFEEIRLNAFALPAQDFGDVGSHEFALLMAITTPYTIQPFRGWNCVARQPTFVFGDAIQSLRPPAGVTIEVVATTKVSDTDDSYSVIVRVMLACKELFASTPIDVVRSGDERMFGTQLGAAADYGLLQAEGTRPCDVKTSLKMNWTSHPSALSSAWALSFAGELQLKLRDDGSFDVSGDPMGDVNLTARNLDQSGVVETYMLALSSPRVIAKGSYQDDDTLAFTDLWLEASGSITETFAVVGGTTDPPSVVPFGTGGVVALAVMDALPQGTVPLQDGTTDLAAPANDPLFGAVGPGSWHATMEVKLSDGSGAPVASGEGGFAFIPG